MKTVAIRNIQYAKKNDIEDPGSPGESLRRIQDNSIPLIPATV